jgi:hypothetical protein
MPRRNDIAKILVISAMLSGYAGAQQSFDQYISHVKTNTTNAVEGDFLHECGVDATMSDHVFGVDRDGKWKRLKNLNRGRYEAETDFLNTAEIRLVDGKPRMLNAWFLIMDEGQESNALICLSPEGVIRFTRAVTTIAPVDGTGNEWTYVQLRLFDANGKVTSKESYFADKKNHRVATPKLSKDDLSILGWNPDHILVSDVLSPLGLMDKGKGR